MSGRAVIAGVNSLLYSPEWNMYLKKQSTNWMDIFGNSDFNFITNGDTKLSFLEAIISSNPRDSIMDGVEDVRDAGTEIFHGAKCHHLILKRSGSDVELWIKTGKQPWIVKVLPFQHHDENMDAVMSISYDRLKANPKVKSAPLRAPLRAKEVTHFVVAPEEVSQHPLLKMPAPDFQLNTLAGKPFKLSEHRNELLIIDFWATWCGPCCRALPDLAQIAQSYKNRNVTLLAVNQEEEPEKIRNYLKKAGLNLRVGLDRDGKVCKQYHVGGIPQTVIIDKNGVVRMVHIGNSANWKEELTGEIEKILQAD
jgi:peroxiredoxin